MVYRLICAWVFQIFLEMLANTYFLLRMCHLYDCSLSWNVLKKKILLPSTTKVTPLTVNSPKTANQCVILGGVTSIHILFF